MNHYTKDAMIPLTDLAEIASVQRNDCHDIIGIVAPDGSAYGYRFSVELWREAQAKLSR